MNRIKEVLEDKGIKQTWLVEKLQYGEWLCPKQTTTCLEVLNEIARILDVDVRQLIMPTKENE